VFGEVQRVGLEASGGASRRRPGLVIVAVASNKRSSRQLCSCVIVCDMSTATTVPHPLPVALVDLIAERFRVLAEPMRIRLLDALRDAPASVQELELKTGASQQNVSKHLGVLLRSGLVSRRKEGNFSMYAIADEAVFELCEHVCGGLRRRLDELDAVLPSGGER
jgi:DNA-binding transcriptional ArsR family regulator